MAPGQAYRNLQGLENYRLVLITEGFAVGNQSGALTITYEYYKNDRHVTVQAATGATTEVYQIAGKMYVPNPAGGFVETDAANPLAIPFQPLLDLPKAVLTNLTPPTAQYTAAGSERLNGRETTKYTGTIALNNLGIVNPALQNQRGTAVTTLWVDNEAGYLSAAQSEITPSGGAQSPAKLRLDVRDVGQVAPLTPPK